MLRARLCIGRDRAGELIGALRDEAARAARCDALCPDVDVSQDAGRAVSPLAPAG